MKEKFLYALLLMIMCYPLRAEKVTCVHNESHLVFTLDLEAKTAMVGTGVYQTSASGFAGSLDLNDNTNYWKNLVIPETIVYQGTTYTVDEIGTCAFNRGSRIQTITIPNTVKSIGTEAFFGCTGLKKLTIPGSVQTIGSGAFEVCRNLEVVHLEEGVRTIGTRMFCDCDKLKSISIPGSCTSIGNDAFTMCNSLYKLVLEDGAETLKLGYSYALGNLYIRESEYEKDHYRGQFADCALDTVYLGRNITYPTVTTYATNTKMCLPFETWRHSFGDEKIPYYYFGPQLECLIFGDEVTAIPESLFSTTSDGGASIKNEVVLPPKLKIIGPYAFYNKYASNTLTQNNEITFPETLDSIGPNAFSGNKKLQVVNSLAVTPPKITSSTFGGCDISVNVANGSGSAYRKDEVWGSFLIVDKADEYITINVKTPGTLYSRLLAQGFQPEDVYKLKLKGTLNEDDISVLGSMTRLHSWDLSEFPMEEISENFFPFKSLLVSVKLPQTLKTIAAVAFQGCYRLVGSIEIPNSCSMIGARAFDGCTRLSGVNFTEGQVIESGAFTNTNIKSITIPKGVSLGASVFTNTGMTEAVIEDGVQEIGDNAFGENLTKLTFNGMVTGNIGAIDSEYLQEIHVPDVETWCKLSFTDVGPLNPSTRLLIGGSEANDIVIPTTVDKVRKYAFYNCHSLSSVVIPEGVDTIGSEAFLGCTNLANIVLPATLATIAEGAFDGCVLLDNVQLPQKLVAIGTRAFKGCGTLKEIKIPSKIIDIKDNAFENCSQLISIDFPTDLSKIGASAFKGCASLKEIDIPLSITSIGSSAFQDCSALDTVVVHWMEPITIDETVFANVSSDCYLLIPLGTAMTYYNAGWNVLLPNLKEAGILDVTANIGGAVYYTESLVRNEQERFYFAPYRSFTLKVLPDDGYHIKRIKINGINATSLIEGDQLYFDEPEENFTIIIVFADDNIVDGDSNGDRKVDEEDAINIVRYGLKDKPESFYDYASDMNEDEIINIVDAIILINNIKR